MERFSEMKKRPMRINERASKLLVDLLELDVKANGGTKADALERLILAGTTCREGVELLAHEGESNPLLTPFCKAMIERHNRICSETSPKKK